MMTSSLSVPKRVTALLARQGIANRVRASLSGLTIRATRTTVRRLGMYLPAHLLADRTTLEGKSRQACQYAYLGGNTGVCRVLGRYKLFVDTTDIGIVPHLCLEGFWESWVTRVMARIVQPGWWCVDVGANHGYYTVLLADGVGPEGRVVSVEPHPRLADLIGRSLAVNGLDHRASVDQRAIAEQSGDSVKLVLASSWYMNGSIMYPPAEHNDVYTVPSVTLDDLTRDWPRLDLIKIDAEGAEQAIWRGARQAFAQHPSVVIIMEINCARYADPEGFLREIEASGFALRYIAYDGTVCATSRGAILSQHFSDDMMLFLKKLGGAAAERSTRGNGSR